MRRTTTTAGVLALLLLVTVPASGAPSLQKGDQAIYNLSASISFIQACNIGIFTSSNMIICPMIATMPSDFDISGTLDWTAVDLNTTTASLNVTRELSTSNGDSNTPVSHTSGSNMESVNLATRIVTLIPLIMPEIDQALQIAQSNMAANLPQGSDWTSSVSMLDNTMTHRSFYTMWWVNGPLKINQTVPVLVLPTNVTRASSIDLGSILGTRTTWRLAYSLSRPLISPNLLAASPSSIPLSNNLELSFTFDYDQASDLLLTANADIHLGFGIETMVQSTPCSSIPSVSCPSSIPSIMMREFGIDIHVALKLVSTTINLTHPMTQTGSSQNGNAGSQSSTGSSPGAGAGTGPGSGSSSGTVGSTSGPGQPAINPVQPRSSLQSLASIPWIYGLLGIAMALVGAGIWIARKRLRRTTSKISSTRPSV